MKRSVALLISGTALCASAAFAQYTEGIVNPFPNSPSRAYAIDDNDQIAGAIVSPVTGHYEGFILGNGVFAEVTRPGATYAELSGINAVTGVVGYTGNAAGTHDFGDRNRGYQTLKGPANFQVAGINASGTFIGNDPVNGGFVSQKGVITYPVPSVCAYLGANLRVILNGINSHGDLVGSCLDKSQNAFSYGFARINGVDQIIADPNAPQFATFPSGINDSGTVVGYSYYGNTYGHTHGFVLSGGVYSPFDFASTPANPVLDTSLYGINNKGSLVGAAFVSNLGDSYGFYAIHN